MKKYINYISIVLFVFAFGCFQMQAQNEWDGDNALGNFSFCNNWNPDVCPATWNSTTDLNIRFKNSVFQTTMYLDFGAWQDINNLTYFASYTSSVTQFDADGPIGNENGLNFYGKIENYSPNLTQVFNLPFHGRNATSIELNPIDGGLTFNRPIFNSGNRNFEVYGPNSRKVTLNDYLEGNGSVGFYIKEYSIVEVNYNNPASLSGGYFVERGELWVESSGVIQGGIQVGFGNANVNKLYISNPSSATTVGNAINVLANSTNATIGSLNTSNTHTYSGTINLNNNAVNFDVVSAGGTVNFTNTISGTGGIQKINPGLVRLSASNTYTGNTVVNAGTLQYGIANAIDNTSNVILNGGKFSTGATVGYSDTVGTLALTDDSTIELGTGNNILTFAASNLVAWTPTKILTITGWTNSCTGAKVFVGVNNTGLTATQLAQITFQGYAAGASISPIGELIPGNVVLTATGGTLLANYATMKATFDAINLGTHTGVITISVLNDINEGAVTSVLNQVAGVTSVLIQPAGCGPRTITGTGNTGTSNPLLDINGADNVTIDGLNINGNSLTISNTSTSPIANTCTIRFQLDATNNLITNCSVLGSATMPVTTAGGNIWFGALSASTGNDNNTISNCNIGPAGVNLPSKGIYFSGNPAFPNDNILITNNNIYDFFNASVSSSGIDLTVLGSSNVSITNNRFYQTATRTQTTGTVHSCIRIGNTSGNNFIITGNTIGYSSSAGTGTYNFVGIASSIFNPIMLSAGAVPASSIQNNTIAGITHSTSTAVFTTLFNAISVTGAGNVNIGNTIGNTIGLPTAPITFNATAGLGGTAFGINMTGTGAVAIQNNTIQSITTTGVAGAAFNITGINVTGAAIYTITNNTIGNVTPANSINLGVLGTSTTGSTFTGINSTSTGSPLNIGASGFSNFIQNITFNATGVNAFNGIVTTGINLTTNITYNSIRGIRFAAATVTASSFTGINNTGAVTGTITISNNTLGIAGTDLVTYTAQTNGSFRGITNNGGAATAALSILSNDFRGVVHAVAANGMHIFISNLATTLSQDISFNTFTNLNVNSTSVVTFLSNSAVLSATGTKNVNSNSIVGTFVKGSASGTLVIYNDLSTSAAGAIINNTNNNFSNISITGTTAIVGWSNTDGAGPNYPVKTITGNTFSNWSIGSSAVTVLNVSALGGALSTVSSNTISNITSTGAITGLNIGIAGSATTLSVNSNNITTLTSSGAGGAVVGISNGQPATTLTNNTNLNTISGLSSTANSVSGITSTAASPTKTISNNNINTLSNAGAIIGISTSGGTTVTIDTNTIATISSTATGAALVLTAINVNGGAAISVTNNAISALSSANDGSYRGIYLNPLGATSNTITGNTINGMTSTSTGVGFSVRAIEVQGANAANISSNTISSINSPTTNVGTGASTPIAAIYCGSSVAGSAINSNTISGMNATSGGAINVTAAAIVTASTTAGGTIAKNRIYGLTNTTTGATNATIGFLPNGGNWTFANNMISITNNNTVRAIGVFDAGAAGARNYYYNSIYIGGTHAGTQVSNAFQYNAAAGTADIRNNIFEMARTSGAKNYAFANTSANFTGVTTNYNVLNCSVAATVGLTNATDRTFATWKTTSGGDANSYSGIAVPFTNTATADLHIIAGCTDIESGGTPVAVLDDYDAAARSVTTPDIGADEFAGTKPADITLTPNTPICLGNNTTLTATSTDLTYVYTWSPATGLSATTGASVIATPIITTTYTVTGTSPASCIKTKEVIVTVNPLPAAITVSPNSVALCPNAIQAFSATPNTGTGTVGTFAGTLSVAANTPYRQGTTTEVKIQYLITKAELNAAGIAGGNFTSIAFNVTTAQPAPMTTYDLFMANTAATVLTSTYLTPAFTTVFSAANLVPTLGLNTHTFSTPFVWDGTSNVVVEIRHTGTAGLASTVQVITPAVISTISRTGGGTFAALTGTTNANRPVITFGYENPITWSPVTELYTDAIATIVYNPLVHLNQPTIYSKSSIARVYTATLTTIGTGCTRTSTGTITMNASTWDGFTWTPSAPTGNSSLSFTGSYTSSGNLSGCSCTVTGGNVVFNGPDALILDNSLTVTAPGTIKFNNNSSLVQIDDTATNSGIITMERITPPIYRFDYTYWGSPVTLASNFTLGGVGGLSPDTLSDKYYSWTPTIANGMGNWFSESAATVMNPIKGYIVRGPQTYSFTSATKVPYTANFIGTPNNGVISCPIYHGTLGGADDTDDWNLLGNPYASAVNALSFLSHATNTPIIDGTIYFWTHNSDISTIYLSPFYGTFVYNYNLSDYATWNRVGSVGTAAGTGGPQPNGYIAAGQGFFTKSTTTAPSGNSVIFNNSMRVTGNNTQFYRMSSPPNVSQENTTNDPIERQRVWLNFTSQSGSFNQILVGYVEGATLGWDRDFDGVRFTDETSITVYSVLEDKKLVIQGRPLPFTETDEVPLGYRTNIHDAFSFSIDHIDETFENQNIYLEDKVLHIIHNLKISPYTFTSEAGTFNERFVLRYTDSALNTTPFDSNQNLSAFIANHELQIKSTEKIVQIELYEISGKLIQVYTPSANDYTFRTNFNFANGAYLAKIKLDNGIEVTKKLIH